MADPTDFVGRGFAFPFRIDHTGSIGLTSGVDDLDSSLRIVLTTAPGERVMRPAFGCRIWNLLFEPINATTIGLMTEAVREAVARWEPRIDLTDVVVDPDPDRAGAVVIHLDYTVRATNDHRNLVFPFYTIPQEAEA